MKTLTFQQFERFGAAVLRELGAKNPKVTAHAGDQGIDFYGELSVGEVQGAPPGFFRLAHDAKLAFAGQAKHYPTRAIGPDVVRELVGAISLARTRTFSKATIDLFEDIDLKPFSPISALLFTTGELSTGALQLAAEAGVIARSGQQLAVFLADRGVGMVGRDEEVKFDARAFADWLARG
jgi:hypothetical protein